MLGQVIERLPRACRAPVYAGFTEGFVAPDLVDAKALLDASGG